MLKGQGWRDQNRFKLPKPKPEPLKSPHGSWWLTAKPEGFTETAKSLITPPRGVWLESLADKYEH